MGKIDPQGHLNGFCIIFNMFFNLIDVGWYKDNMKHGNWMQVQVWDMEVKQ